MGQIVDVPRRPARRPLNLAFVAGTRPEAIKLAPLLMAAKWRPDLRCTLVATGQHGALFHEALAPFALAADMALGPGDTGLTIEALARRIAETLPPVLDRLAADCVVVQGDTTSAWAAALAARRHGVPVAHVEAGLRSGDPNLPWPEERNRTEIDHVADLLFAPCERAAANLRAEGVGGRVHVTGNSGIDALLFVRAGLPEGVDDDPANPTIFVTCHRRENAGRALERICEALRVIARRPGVTLIAALPGDPAKAERLSSLLAGHPAIILEAPLDYPRAVQRIRKAHLVLSDSGGLQEECAALGVPLLVLRDVSERPEVVASGNALLIGTETDAIVAATMRLLDDPAAHAAMAKPSYPYGDGDAAERMLRLFHLFPFPRG